MAAPTYSTDLADIIVPTGSPTPTISTTGWSAFGGGASGLNEETDYYIIDSGCLSKNAWQNDDKGMTYAAGATTVTAGDAVFTWVTHLVANAIEIQDPVSGNGGLYVCIGSGSGAYDIFWVSGSDFIVYDDRWICAVVDPTLTPDATVGSPTATLSQFGAGSNVGPGPTKGSPFAVGGIRHGRALTCVDGDLANGYATFDGAATFNDAGGARYGQIQKSNDQYKMQGLFQMGSVATAVDFRDANRSIVVARTPKVAAGFNGFEVVNAASNVEWDSISIKALGTTSRGYFDQVTAGSTVTIVSSSFVGMSTFGFLSTATVNDTTFRGCGQITAAGTDMRRSVVANYTGATDTSALVWNVATNPNGLLDGMTFTKGTGTTHAIEFGLSSPTTIDLVGVTFNGYNAANGQTDSAVHIRRTAGAVTINVSGGVAPSYKSDGATVQIVSANTLTITGLKNPTEVRVFDKDTTTEIAGQENVTTGVFSTSIDAATYPDVDVSILALGFINIRLDGDESVDMTSDQTIPIQQQIDRQYENV